jgi:hypothetical protein
MKRRIEMDEGEQLGRRLSFLESGAKEGEQVQVVEGHRNKHSRHFLEN